MDLLTVTSKLRQAFQDVARVIDGDNDRLSVTDLMLYCADTTPSETGTISIVLPHVCNSFICISIVIQLFVGGFSSSTSC